MTRQAGAFSDSASQSSLRVSVEALSRGDAKVSLVDVFGLKPFRDFLQVVIAVAEDVVGRH